MNEKLNLDFDEAQTGAAHAIENAQRLKDSAAAHAVAIHMITEQDTGELVTKHFVSDRTEGRQDTEGKFYEAAEKLVDAGKADPVLRSSSGYDEFEDLYDDAHFPQLGYVKKLSMIHHMELMADRT